MTEDPIIYYGFFDFRLDVENEELLKNGNRVKLTHKAFQILLLLVQNSGRTTTKADIFDQLWSDRYVEKSNLTQHIHLLRKVLGNAPNGQAYVETVPRLGYRFTLQSEQISIAVNCKRERRFAADNFFQRLGIRPTRNGSRNFLRSVRSRPISDVIHSSRSLILRIAPLLILVLAAMPAILYFGQSLLLSGTEKEPVIRSIAILPFKPSGDKGDKRKLGFGMTDAVITRLRKSTQITVRPTSAISRFTDAGPIDAVKAGHDLEVDAILEGTVQCDGESLHVSVTLIRIADAKPMWTETFDEKMSDIFTVQESVSRKVAAALSANLQQRILVKGTQPSY